MNVKVAARAEMRACAALRAKVDARAQQLVTKAANDIKAGAQDNITTNKQIDTGYMKNTMTVKPGDNGLSADIGPAAEYGIYQELGTRSLRPRPYLVPAFERVRGPFLAAWEELVR